MKQRHTELTWYMPTPMCFASILTNSAKGSCSLRAMETTNADTKFCDSHKNIVASAFFAASTKKNYVDPQWLVELPVQQKSKRNNAHRFKFRETANCEVHKYVQTAQPKRSLHLLRKRKCAWFHRHSLPAPLRLMSRSGSSCFARSDAL